jgi:hypothetical protein
MEPVEIRDVEDPTFSRLSALTWQCGCEPYAPAALPPNEILGSNSWYSGVDPGTIVQLDGLGNLKTKISDLFPTLLAL